MCIEVERKVNVAILLTINKIPKFSIVSNMKILTKSLPIG